MILTKRLFQRSVCAIIVGMLGLLSLSAQAQLSAFEDPSSGGTGAAAGAQEFAPIKPEIEGGDVAQGQTGQVIVMMRNNGAAPIKFEKAELVPSSNVTATIAANQCSVELVKPGFECPITVSIKAEASGKYRVGMLVNHTGRTKISNMAIVGNVGTGAAASIGPLNEVEAFPMSMDFGTAKGRAPLVRSLSLRNSSAKAIEIQGIELAASPLTGFSVSAPECKELQPLQSCVATVTWSPMVEGKAEGVIVLRHSGPSGSMQLPVTGEYTQTKTEKAMLFPSAVPGQGLIVADRESVEFGASIDGAASITVSLINAGDKDVKFTQVRLAGSDNGLSLSGDDCATGKTLGPNQGCALTVNWLPRRKGPVIDDIQITHNGARGVLVLPVRGTATETVSLNMPMLGGSSLPKISNDSIDEKILGDVGTEKKASPRNGSGPSGLSLANDVSALNGYRVTSLSDKRGVVTGPRGRIIVEDGVPQVIAGSYWIPRIMAEGVELIGGNDSVVLLFDRSLGAISPAIEPVASASSSMMAAAPATPSGGGSSAP